MMDAALTLSYDMGRTESTNQVVYVITSQSSVIVGGEAVLIDHLKALRRFGRPGLHTVYVHCPFRTSLAKVRLETQLGVKVNSDAGPGWRQFTTSVFTGDDAVSIIAVHHWTDALVEGE
jgi:hypothetical protein